MLDRDDEYHLLNKKYKLKKIEVASFKTFLKYQSIDRKFVFDFLSKSLITAKNKFILLYNEELGIRNIHFLDRSVDEAFNDVFISVLRVN